MLGFVLVKESVELEVNVNIVGMLLLMISAIIRVNTTSQRQKKSVKLIVCRFMVFPPLILIKISPQRYRITNPRLACCL